MDPMHPRVRLRSRARSALIGATLAAGLIVPHTASADPTADANFVQRVYDDFLGREPSAGELSSGVSSVAAGSRTTYVTNILNGSEFKAMWVGGVELRYLDDVDESGTLHQSAVSSLQSNGNFLATEATVLASSEYFAENGSNNTSFVQALYLDVLYRGADPSGLSYWVGRLSNGSSTRAQVASNLLRSDGSAGVRVSGANAGTTCESTDLTSGSDDNPGIGLKAGSYCIVLDRMSDPSGGSYWKTQLSQTGQIVALWASLAGSNEYFNHAQN